LNNVLGVPEDRYEPLPPVTRLPSLAWSRMGTPGRVLTVLAGLGAIAAVVILAPKIADTKSHNEARDRREAAAARARHIRQIRELQRPRSAAFTAQDPRPELERLITTDARSRPDASPVLRTDCKAIPGGAGRFSCTAVTSDIPGGSVSRGGSIGYPFRALVKGRRLTWCRVAGRPGEGSNTGRALVSIPTSCGG
jgi:hypothetical protein